jgi:hypothetical protein
MRSISTISKSRRVGNERIKRNVVCGRAACFPEFLLRIDEIPPDEARRELCRIMPASVVEMLLDAWSAAGQLALVTSTVAETTGTPARMFLGWATDHAADFREYLRDGPP